MAKALLISAFLLLLPASFVGANNCTIDCLHNTHCARGQANFSWHPNDPATGKDFDFSTEIERDGWHCACPPGWTGLRCGHKYESCNDSQHVCFNGGECIATLEDIYQNNQLYCDCPATVDANGNTKRYSGKYCEVETTLTKPRCTQDNNLCLNGGTCKTIVDEIDPCDCPENYVGRICEYFKPAVPICNLQCQNGGACRYGTKEENQTLTLQEPNGPEQHTVEVVHQNFMYCECPPDFAGVHCETQEQRCGDIKCMHGSSCVSLTNKDSGETTHHCDCMQINTQKLEKGEDVQFAGRHCEIQSTSVCHYDDDGASSTFCTHNGTCPVEAHEQCGCLDGYNGAHCQFRDGENVQSAQAVASQTCKLQCKNEGTCRKGSNQDAHVQSLLQKYGSELGAVGLNMTYNEDFEHCSCPQDFVGIECEYSMKSCGVNGQDHPCFHGSACTMVNNVPTCVCTGAETQAAGIYCQHVATAVCSVADNLALQPQTNGNRGFCVNGGVCVTDKDGEAACRCHTQYEGPHCEYTKNSTDTQVQSNMAANNIPPGSEPTGRSGPATFGVVVAILLCLGVVGFGIVTYRRKRSEIEECSPPVYPDLDNTLALDDNSLRATPVKDFGGPQLDFGPSLDFDGNELKNVELL